jgi:predicted transcriptional regulator
MPTIAIEPELYKRVEEAARASRASENEVLAEALRQFFWELDRRKISAESKAYQQQHAKIKMQYLGQYVAMDGGQVVDHDSDFAVLRHRIRERFGRTAIMIARVEETVETAFTRHGFRMEPPPK